MTYLRPKGSGIRSDEIRFRVKPLKVRAEAPLAKSAKRCQCDKPATYRDEDGELRCLCGRGV